MNKKYQTGITFIELMIVVAIVGILTMIAVPSYLSYIQKSRRTEARNTLLQMQLAEEKWRTNNPSYGTLANIWGGVTNSENGHYNLAISNLSATSYTLTATGVGSQTSDAQQGQSCGVMSITMTGVAESKAPLACWNN